MKRGRPSKTPTAKNMELQRPKRMKLHNKMAMRPTKKSKRRVPTRSWQHLNQDDDSSFSPSMCTFINSNAKGKHTEAAKSGMGWISAFPDLHMFENEECLHEGLKELSKIMHKISL